MLRELAAGRLWVSEMRAAKAGFEFGARMTVVRLPGGGLWVHSPVALTPDLKRELNALGPVRALVSPARYHCAHLAEFASAYPEALCYAPPHFRRALPGVTFARTLDDVAPPPEWSGVLEQLPFQGSRLYDEVEFYHPETRTLIVTDLCFHIPADAGLVTRTAARMLGILGRLSVSHSFPLTIGDREAVRASLRRIAAWDFDRVILSHGILQDTGGKQEFERAFAPYL